MSVMSALKNVAKTAWQFTDKNMPTILTVTTCIGAVVTTVLAVENTKSALEELEMEREYREEQAHANSKVTGKVEVEDISAWDVVKLCWPCYIPTGLSLGATIAAAIGAHVTEHKRLVTAVAAAELAEESLRTYRRKIREQIGENKERAIVHDIHKEELERTVPPEEMVQSATATDGTCLFYDPKSGQYFVSTIEKVKRAFISANTKLREDGYDWVDLGDVLYDAGAKEPEIAYNYGFAAQADGRDAIDIKYLLDPHIEEFHGHEVTVVYVEYDVQDRLRYY